MITPLNTHPKINLAPSLVQWNLVTKRFYRALCRITHKLHACTVCALVQFSRLVLCQFSKCYGDSKATVNHGKIIAIFKLLTCFHAYLLTKHHSCITLYYIYFQIRRRRLARLDRSPRTDPTASPSQEARTPTKAAAPVSPTQAAASPVHVPRLSLETDSAGQSGKPAQEPRWSSHGPWAFKRPPRTLVSTPRRGPHEDLK